MISLTSPVRTRAHDWPAGAKLAGLALATTALFLLPGPGVQLAALGIVAVLHALPGRAFLAHALGQLRVVWPLALLVGIWAGLGDGRAEGLRVALRMTNAIALANLVTMTTSLDDMSALFDRLLGPLGRLGLPVGAVRLAAVLVIRFAPVLIGHARQLALAWRARSPRRPGWRLVGPLALAALDDADRVAEALRARGGVPEGAETHEPDHRKGPKWT